MIIRGKYFVLPLCIGIIFGSGMTFIILNLQSNSNPNDYVDWNLLNYLIAHDKDIQKVNKEIAAQIEKESEERARVLCWIMTGPANHLTKAIHVRNTWGKRCNKLLFMSSAKDEELGSIALPNVEEGREFLWEKTRQAFKYAYENYYQDADWFFKADDDTYTIVENLRLLLEEHNPWDPIYFGTRLKQFVAQGYMSGGAGYVLSKEALRRFVELGLKNSSVCPPSTENEDVEMGKCLQLLGVQPGDARDKLGRNRFLPLSPENHLIPGHSPEQRWYARSTYYEQEQGLKCCSDEGITFHYMPPAQMYVMDYLIYQLKPHFSQKQRTSDAIETQTD